MNRKLLNITVGILLVVIFGLWLFVFQVKQSEVALVTTFGKPTRTITNAGPYLKWPWPIQRVHTFDQRIQDFETQDMLDEPQTADGKILLAMVYVGWQITDPGEFYSKFANRSVSDPEAASIATARGTLEEVVRSTKNAVIGHHPFSDFISTDPGQFKLEAIEGEMLSQIEGAVETNGYGIAVRFLGIKKLELPESSTQEVFTQMASERAILVSKIQRDGDTAAANIRTAANSYSSELKANADAEAKRIRGEAEAEVVRYFEVFKQNPDLATFILKLDALKASLGSHATLIFDHNTEPFDLLSSTNAAGKK